MRALVTGAGGFAGRHAVERLRAAGVETFAFEGDIRDADACLGQVRASRPDAVLHLAAISSVADAWRRPDVVADVNVGGTRNLLDAVAAAAPAARFVLVSSAEVYGAVPEARPADRRGRSAPAALALRVEQARTPRQSHTRRASRR